MNEWQVRVFVPPFFLPISYKWEIVSALVTNVLSCTLDTQASHIQRALKHWYLSTIYYLLVQSGEKLLCLEMPKEGDRLFQNRNRRTVYDVKWLNHRSVKLNIDTNNLSLKYSLVLGKSKKEGQYCQVANKSVRRRSSESPFISSSSFIQDLALTTDSTGGTVLEMRDRVRNNIRPFPGWTHIAPSVAWIHLTPEEHSPGELEICCRAQDKLANTEVVCHEQPHQP